MSCESGLGCDRLRLIPQPRRPLRRAGGGFLMPTTDPGEAATSRGTAELVEEFDMTDPSRPYDPDDICDDETYLTGRREKHLGFKRSARANLHTFPGGAPLGRIEALGALAQLGEVVYAVSTPDGQVKIGHTKNLYNRMRTFATGHRSRDFTLLAFTFGTHEDEMAVHHQLADHRHHGREWYNPTPEVLAVVNGWREALGRDPLAA